MWLVLFYVFLPFIVMVEWASRRSRCSTCSVKLAAKFLVLILRAGQLLVVWSGALYVFNRDFNCLSKG